MQILFVCATLPNRSHIRTNGILRALAGRGHRITLVCGVGPHSHHQIAELWEYGLHIVAIPQYAVEQRWHTLRTLFGPLPMAAASKPRLFQAVYAEARSKTYDIAHVDGITVSTLSQALNGIPVVLDVAGCSSLVLSRKTRASWQQGARTAHELARVRYHEADYLANYDRVITASADDAWALRLLNHATIKPAPHAIHAVPTPVMSSPDSGLLTLRAQDTLLLCAGPAGQSASTMEVIAQVMPQIWQQRADIRLQVLGPLPAQFRNRANNPRIQRVSAEDLQAVARATIALAPGDSQSADQALQAMGMGTPLITSRLLGRALQAVDGRDLLLAEGPDALAKAILELLDDPRYRGHLGRAGRMYVQQQHDPEAAARNLEQIYAAARGGAIANWSLDMGMGQLLQRELGT